jgi:hypothetical protein
VRFGLDGHEYELDLCAAHTIEFSGALQRFVDAGARELQGGAVGAAASRASRNGRGRSRSGAAAAAAAAKASGPRRRAATRSSGTTEVREWARANGIAVSTRGRISKEVMDAYNARSGSRSRS